MKRAFILFWHGLKGLFRGLVDMVATLFGMKDESKYGRFLRRVTSTCFALLTLMITFAAGWQFFHSYRYRMLWRRWLGESYYVSRFLTPNVSYYNGYDVDGYVKTSDGKKTVTGISWIAEPEGDDSLVCYSDGKLRGYFNRNTGEPVIKPQYAHAWVFSEGLASVDDGGWIKFIDTAGRVVIDPKLTYIPGADGFAFHGGHCVVHDKHYDNYGLLGRDGQWLLPMEYSDITSLGNLWVVRKGEETSVLDSTLNTVLPFFCGSVWVGTDYLSVTLADHTIRRYDYSGNLINDFYINDVTLLTYDTDELRYVATKNYNDEGELESETEETEPRPVRKPAKCRLYEASSGWYGLMTADGKVLTLPSYNEIKAIGPDLYQCKDNSEDGVLLNGEGKRIR